MIIRYAGRVVTIDKLTRDAVRELFQAHDVRSKLAAARQALITEDASRSLLALRRLREKVKRLERQLARYESEPLSPGI